MKKAFILFLILCLASFLRLYQLGQNPPSLDWDEASLGYNAYSLLKTGKDEFGRSWPASIRSFEDYKPAGYTYSSILPISLFGLTEWSVRSPSAMYGILSVFLTYILVAELGKQGLLFQKTQHNQKAAIFASFLLAVSPWHLQFSRIAFEANSALFWVLLGIVCFLKGLQTGAYFLGASAAFALSFYFYHSPRLVVPLIILGWTIYWYKTIWRQKKWIVMSIILGFVVLIPFMKEGLGSNRARLSSVTLINSQELLNDSIKKIEEDSSHNDLLGTLAHNRRIVYLFAVMQGYLDHFNLDFLFLTGDLSGRHHASDMGMLYIWEAPFILIGSWFFLSKKRWPILWWFLVVPVASAITKGTPHAVRTLLYLPLYQIWIGVGLVQGTTYIKQKFDKPKRIGYLITSMIALFTLFIGINFYYYFDSYYIQTPIEGSQDWQYGFKQVSQEVRKYESIVDSIVITYKYDQPHAFTLFYNQIEPEWYQSEVQGQEVKRQERSFGKYEFRNISWEEDQYLKNTLLIGTPKEIPETAPNIIKEIQFLDGSVAFRIVKS